MKTLKGVLVRSRKNFLSFCDIWKKLFLRFSELIFDQYCSIFFQFFFTRFRSFKLLLAIPVGFQAVSAAGPTGLPTSEMIKIVLLAVNKFSTSCSTARLVPINILPQEKTFSRHTSAPFSRPGSVMWKGCLVEILILKRACWFLGSCSVKMGFSFLWEQW